MKDEKEAHVDVINSNFNEATLLSNSWASISRKEIARNEKHTISNHQSYFLILT